MAKLTRETAKVFGANASSTGDDPAIGQFGSAKAATYVGTGDIATIQALPAWNNGWIDAVTPTQQFPTLPEMTGVHKVLSYQGAYLLQEGIPEYDAGTTYYKNSICKAENLSNKLTLYKSLVNDNIGNPLTDTSKWEEVSFGGTRNIGEIVTSSIPLSDSNLHLLDGGKLLEGSYAAFIKYIADLYNASIEYSDIFSKVGSPTISSAGIASGFTTSNYLYKNNAVTIGSDGIFEIDLANITISDTTDFQYVLNLVNSNSYQNGEIVLRKATTNGGWQILFFGASNALLAIFNFSRTDITSCKLGYDGTKYYATINNGTPQEETTSSKITSGDYNLFIGVRNNAGTPTQPLTNGSIDLKQIAISINGVTTFDSSKSLDCFTDEATWQATKTAYGVCGKFVYDRVHNSVRLPKIKGFIEGTDTTTTLGDVVEAGLPNITGQLDNNMAYSPTATGAFENVEGGNHYGAAGSSYPASLGFDASRSSSIYGNSTTVQPQSVKVLYYIVIATETKTDIKVDIDQIATDLNGKADIDFTNVNNLGTAKSAGWAMPSYRSKDMMPYLQSTEGAYTADANGYIAVQGYASTSNQAISIISYGLGTNTHSVSDGDYLAVALPVAKGHTYSVIYNIPSLSLFRFYYAEGEQ